jgi:hypothetical protein
MDTSVRDCVRCTAITARGTRCIRNTCIYPGECYQHFKQNHGLYLAPSSIPNSGLGLFTSKTINRKSKIADYTGYIEPNDTWELNKSNYGVKYNDTQTLDGRSTQTGIARYSNDCRPENINAGLCTRNNAHLRFTEGDSLILESKCPIRPDTEVFNSYGKRYWRNRDV